GLPRSAAAGHTLDRNDGGDRGAAPRSPGRRPLLRTSPHHALAVAQRRPTDESVQPPTPFPRIFARVPVLQGVRGGPNEGEPDRFGRRLRGLGTVHGQRRPLVFLAAYGRVAESGPPLGLPDAVAGD